MNIALLGYGKMGKMIDELLSKEGKHKVILKINSSNRNTISSAQLKQADVVIEFSNPSVVLENISLCMKNGIPLVVGTTGWSNQLDEVKKMCEENNGALVYGSNFSIGVNIFFELNKKLATLMKSQPSYEPVITEIHHKQKKDAPSGTAITLANNVLLLSANKKKWVNHKSDNPTELIILSRREDSVTGTHVIQYVSDVDSIEIKHEAFSRAGFAQGAILAAEWIINKKGCYEFRDVLADILK